MKKRLTVIAAICLWVVGVVGVQAEEVVPREAIITNADGTEETLVGAEKIATRLNVFQKEGTAEIKLGYEAILKMGTVFPKDASQVYVSVEVNGLVPGDDVEVYQNGQIIPGEVTGVNELTFRMQESGTIDVYKKQEKDALEAESTNDAEIAVETEAVAPATGESEMPYILEILTVLFGGGTIFSLYMTKKQTK